MDISRIFNKEELNALEAENRRLKTELETLKCKTESNKNKYTKLMNDLANAAGLDSVETSVDAKVVGYHFKELSESYQNILIDKDKYIANLTEHLLTITSNHNKAMEAIKGNVLGE